MSSISTVSDPSETRLKDDERGAIMVAGIFMCGLLCAFLWFIIGIGNAILYRESLQDSADALAFTGAVFHAHGMQIIVLLNLIMTALVAILVILRALEMILIGLIIICTILTAIPWTAAFGGSCLAFANPVKNAVTNVANNLDDNVLAKVLPKLNAASRGLSLIFPWLAQGKTVAHGMRLSKRSVYTGGIEVGAMLSKSLIPKGVSGYKVGLPIEEDTKTFRGRTGNFLEGLMKSVIPGAFGKLLGGVFGKGADVLGFRAHLTRGRCDNYTNKCGEKVEPPPLEEFEFKASDFDSDIRKTCDKGREDCETSGNTYQFEQESLSKEDDYEVSGTQTITKNKSEMKDCNEVPQKPSYDKRCDKPLFSSEDDWPITCKLVPNAEGVFVDNPDYDVSNQPPGVYECWDRRDECSRFDKNGVRFKVDGKDEDVHGHPIERLNTWKYDHSACMERERANVQKELDAHKAAQNGGSGSGSGGSSSDCEGPKKLYCEIEHTGDGFFAVYATALGKSPDLSAREGVAVAAPGVERKQLSALAQAATLGTAQAEFYYADNGWADKAMWNFRWQARLRFFHLPEELEEFVSAAGDAVSKLEGLANVGGILEDRASFLVNCARSCVGDLVDTDCVNECLAIELELPINRFQSIH